MSSAIYTQVDIEREMKRLLDGLQDECLEQLRVNSIEAAHAEVDYKVSYAKAYLKATGTGPIRNSTATVETETELFRRLASERAVVTAREKLNAYRASLDSLRTLLVGVREQTR